MNFILSSDDNYAQHMGVAIYSILDHNRDADAINIKTETKNLHFADTIYYLEPDTLLRGFVATNCRNGNW